MVCCRLTVGIHFSGNLRIVLNDVLGQVCCPETSVNNYHLTLLKAQRSKESTQLHNPEISRWFIGFQTRISVPRRHLWVAEGTFRFHKDCHILCLSVWLITLFHGNATYSVYGRKTLEVNVDRICREWSCLIQKQINSEQNYVCEGAKFQKFIIMNGDLVHEYLGMNIVAIPG